jgi:uncharacterized protein DUF2567
VTDDAAGPESLALLDERWGYRRARVVTRADLLRAVSITSLVSLPGLPLGWIWSRIAPPERMGAVSTGRYLWLTDEDYHRFDDLAVFVLLGFGAGLLAGVAVWLLRERRGPIVLLAAALGSLIAGYLAMRTGISFAGHHYPVPSALSAGQLFDKAPVLESSWIIVAQPLGVVLVYGMLAAWSGSPDLGRRLG